MENHQNRFLVGSAIVLNFCGGIFWGIVTSGLMIIVALLLGDSGAMLNVPNTLINILFPLMVVLPGLAVAWVAGWRRALRILRSQEGARPSLLQFMIFIVGLGALAFALPILAKLNNDSIAGATKNELGAIRSALDAYHKMTGAYPRDLHVLVGSGKQLESIPRARTPVYHDSSAIFLGTQSNDAGGWMYDGAGSIWVNCTHSDSKLNRWDSY